MKPAMKLWAIGVALALAACGPKFDAGFDAQFEKSAKESCVSTATGRGAALDKVEPYCACFVGQFKDMSTRQKMALTPTSPEIAAAAAACRSSVMGVSTTP